MYFVYLSTIWLVLSSGFARAQCPNDAVFLALEDQIRGFSLRANGSTAPCQVIQGTNTGLQTARSIAIDRNGFLHVAQFLTDGTIDIFQPAANGNVSPSRATQVGTNDLPVIAVDSGGNDWVGSLRGSHILYSPKGASGQQLPSIVLFEGFAGGLAVDKDDNLLVGGYDLRISDAPMVRTFATSRTKDSPPVLRKISGSSTGLLPLRGPGSGLSIALDPSTDDLYVYNSDGQNSQVSVFPARMSGNIAPVRVIGGTHTTISPIGAEEGPNSAFDKIAVSSDGRLFVAQPDRILVFAPGSNGDVSPSQVIQDATLSSTPIARGGIAVRSCYCSVLPHPRGPRGQNLKTTTAVGMEEFPLR